MRPKAAPQCVGAKFTEQGARTSRLPALGGAGRGGWGGAVLAWECARQAVPLKTWESLAEFLHLSGPQFLPLK